MIRILVPLFVLVTLGQVSGPIRPGAATGVINGIVVDERQKPISRAQVQAFSALTSDAQVQHGRIVPFSMRASGSTSTDAEGRFQISGLAAGEYLVAAEPVPFLMPRASGHAVYGATFHPSTIDHQAAVRVSATAPGTAPIRIELVRVRGARVSGSVVSQPGRSAVGMDVRVFRRFGGFGADSPVAVVEADGRFEISRVPPGWYRLTIAPRQMAGGERSEFATTLIEVTEKDVDGVVLTMSTGASISGRVVAGAGVDITSALGFRVSASPTDEQYGPTRSIAAAVASDGSFRMTGLSGSYRFTAGTDRPPLRAVRFTIDGAEIAADTGVELTAGSHELVVAVAPHVSPPSPTVDKSVSPAALVEQFKSETVFFKQFDIAREIVNRDDASVLPSLTPWLSHEDRHARGNAAFIFAALGDPRGFQVITGILTDQSDRPPNHGVTAGRWTLKAQIRSDRYYAVHLLGDLRDPRAVPILIPLLKDQDVNYIVPWSLGQIGDRSAVGPLLETLDGDNPSIRVLAIYALETLNAKEALPRLTSLLDDHRKSNFGGQVSVAEAAKAAIAKLR